MSTSSATGSRRGSAGSSSTSSRPACLGEGGRLRERTLPERRRSGAGGALDRRGDDERGQRVAGLRARATRKWTSPAGRLDRPIAPVGRRTGAGPPPTKPSGGEVFGRLVPGDGDRDRDCPAPAEVERFDHSCEVLSVESARGLPDSGRLLRIPELGCEIDEQALASRHRLVLPEKPLPAEVVLE